MRSPSIPKISRNNPKEYYIYWNHDVPPLLWPFYPRKRIRIKVSDDINYHKGQDRENYAELRRRVWEYRVIIENYNPFAEELQKLQDAQNSVMDLKEQINFHEQAVIQKAAELTPQEKLKQTPVVKAFDLWLNSRRERTKNGNSVFTYQTTSNMLKDYFTAQGRENDSIGSITRMDIANALLETKKGRGWNATTYNGQKNAAMNVFNWLELEEYIDNNPIRGKIQKMQGKKQKHKWYNRETKERVKKALTDASELTVLWAMQFTYELFIRSKTELSKLKAGDIDRDLKRVRFSDDLSKNNSEAYRDYEPEFDLLLDQMNFNSIPKDFYIFGYDGKPSTIQIQPEYLSKKWRPVRDSLGLSKYYTIYGMKHTRIVHELFKGTDGYDISHMARHEDPKSTKEYMRDYDITLRYKYAPEDLAF